MLLIAGILIIFGCLTAFNIDLKKSYLTGEYKSRYKDMTFTAFKGVDHIDIATANSVGITIEQGDKEGIWINKEAKDMVQFEVNQNTLLLHGAADEKTDRHHSWNHVIIVTKTLNSLITKTSSMDKASRSAAVSGYQINHLDLQLSSQVNLFMDKMQIDSLKAIVGSKTGSAAELIISSKNTIKAAQLNVPGNGKLTLLDPKITKSTYLLSDSATVTLNGKPTYQLK